LNTNLKSEISLRPATLDDVDALTALSYKTISQKHPEVIGSDAVEGYIASGAVPKYYTERNAFLWVAERGEEPVGAVAIKDNEIHLMMVTVDHHRKGIGEALLEHGERLLYDTFGTIELESFRDNAQAVNFYRKHGWQAVSEYPMPEVGIPMVRMGKQRISR